MAARTDLFQGCGVTNSHTRLTREQIEEARTHLNATYRLPGKATQNTLCDMALALLAVSETLPPREPTTAMLDAGVKVYNYWYGCPAHNEIGVVIWRAMWNAGLKSATPQGEADTSSEASCAKPAGLAPTPNRHADLVRRLRDRAIERGWPGSELFNEAADALDGGDQRNAP